MNKYSHYAILAGLCASCGSIFGKISGLPVLEDYLILRILSIILMLLSNAFVWTLFVKALQASNSSLSPTIISTVSNYLLSAFVGHFLFGEVTSVLWWIGISIIMCGLVLILKGEQKNITVHEKNNKDNKES